MLQKLVPIFALMGVEPFYGLAQSFYPKMGLSLMKDVEPVELSPAVERAFQQIKESVGIQEDILLYQGDVEAAMPSSRWSIGPPVMLFSRYLARQEIWPNAHYDFSVRENLLYIKLHHGFMAYLAWCVCLVVGAYFAFHLKKSPLFILAYFVGKYATLQISRMQRAQAFLGALALCNQQQIASAEKWCSQELRLFRSWRKKSLWRRFFYVAEGGSRFGGMLWENGGNFELLTIRLERIRQARLAKISSLRNGEYWLD